MHQVASAGRNDFSKKISMLVRIWSDTKEDTDTAVTKLLFSRGTLFVTRSMHRLNVSDKLLYFRLMYDFGISITLEISVNIEIIS